MAGVLVIKVAINGIHPVKKNRNGVRVRSGPFHHSLITDDTNTIQ